MAYDKKASDKAYRERNRERIAAYHKAWYERNRERRAATVKAYRERNREREAETNKAWRERNRERKAETNKAWRERNRERVAATEKAWRERNRERKAATIKAWYERNRERKAATDKAWRERNPERKAATIKAWRERNPELLRERERRKRAKYRNAQVTLTANEKAKLLVLERTRKELQKETGRDYHIDHILPLAHGGIHHPINLRILEGVENRSKNAKLLPEAIDLAYDHYKLYYERISPERAEEFVKQLANAIGLNEEEIDLKNNKLPAIPQKATLEDLFI